MGELGGLPVDGGAVRRTRPPDASRPAILIAATHSGAGKTTATGVVLRALRRRGLTVQPFKLGPDFIDPGYHAEATGRPSINLDVWMMGPDGVQRSYRRWSRDADVCVIEAMGALYDGENGTEHGSAAHVAKLLGVPVVVVLDVWGMTRTAGAILDGLQAFDPQVPIAGCVLNRTGSPAHAAMVTEALAPHLRGLVVGAIPRWPALEIPERHLGLLTVEENAAAAAAREEAYGRASELLDVDRLLHIAGIGASVEVPTGTAPTSSTSRSPGGPETLGIDGARATAQGPPRGAEPVARLAIARDAAFCFLYEENLRLLQDAGFELVPFRPTVDPRLPADVDAVYLGGGYPESFAALLEANRSLAAELRERAAEGLPIYAECGGLVYLGRSLVDFDGTQHAMSGVLPLDTVMDRERLTIRYVELRTREPSPLGAAGTTVRGQEFHQSRIVAADLDPTLFDVVTSSGETFRAGYRQRNVVASYAHLHFASNRRVVAHLVRSAGRRTPPPAG